MSEGGEARPEGTQATPCVNAIDPEARAKFGFAKFWFDQRELDVLCESLWHSLSRADVPDADIDTMRVLRERLNDARR
jgi:hypothetical protein